MKNQGATPSSPPSSPRFAPKRKHLQRGARNVAAPRAALSVPGPRSAFGFASLDGDDKNGERGSIFVWIFVMISLFAALSWAMIQGGASNTSTLTEQQAKLAATEIVTYATQMKSAVHSMIINGCKDTEISFHDASTGSSYLNPNTTSDNCKVFHPQGGGLRPLELDSQLAFYIRYVGRNALHDVGVSNCGDISCSDLIIVGHLKEGSNSTMVCDQFNLLVGNSDLLPPISTTYVNNAPLFVGTYGPYTFTAREAFKGKKAACYEYSPSPGEYLFYYVLLAR